MGNRAWGVDGVVGGGGDCGCSGEILVMGGGEGQVRESEGEFGMGMGDWGGDKLTSPSANLLHFSALLLSSSSICLTFAAFLSLAFFLSASFCLSITSTLIMLFLLRAMAIALVMVLLPLTTWKKSGLMLDPLNIFAKLEGFAIPG